MTSSVFMTGIFNTWENYFFGNFFPTYLSSFLDSYLQIYLASYALAVIRRSNDNMHQPDDAIAMLTADHRQVHALFQQYEDTPDPYLKQIIAEHVFAELTLHMLLDE